MEVVKRGYGLYSVAMAQSEVDGFECACQIDHRLSEDVLLEVLERFIQMVKETMTVEGAGGT